MGIRESPLFRPGAPQGEWVHQFRLKGHQRRLTGGLCVAGYHEQSVPRCTDQPVSAERNLQYWLTGPDAMKRHPVAVFNQDVRRSMQRTSQDGNMSRSGSDDPTGMEAGIRGQWYAVEHSTHEISFSTFCITSGAG